MATTLAGRTAVVVTNYPERDALDKLVDYPEIDVAVFESPETAYGRIKRERPAVVILDLPFKTATEFALLAMLKLDRETAGITLVSPHPRANA
jgi:FixJ family two-component response regulator